jgi:hypothetical protein
VSESAFLLDGAEVHPLLAAEVVVGRESPADLRFAYPQVSRRHARLARSENGYTVCDLSSRFGTFLNGKPVGQAPMALKDGDELVLGGALSLRFHDPAETRGGQRVGRIKGVWIDPETSEVWVDGKHVSPALSAAQLVLAVWPDAQLEGVSEEAIDGLIKRLRGRLREAGQDPIEVRRGRGLRLVRN